MPEAIVKEHVSQIAPLVYGLVSEQNFAFSAGIEVCDVAQSKGLEFDYVILLDVSDVNYPATPAARRILHVGATRAAHQLWVTTVGKASPLLAP